MAENQPAPNSAPDGGNATPPQVPPVQPADGTPPAATPTTNTPPASGTGVTLTDDQKTYLKGQGLTDDELASPEAISKIIGHAQSSQKTLAQTNAELEKIRNAANPTPPAPANPFGTPPVAQPSTTQPTPETSQPAPAQGIDAVTAFTLATSLGSQFPTLAEDLSNGKFYEDMTAMGIPVTVNGQVNLTGIQAFGKRESEYREAAKKIAEAAKPSDDIIPDANPTVPQQPASDAPMTKQMAQAILFQDPNHARAAEAQAFLAPKKK